jgi:GTP cyclohydrolase I
MKKIDPATLAQIGEVFDFEAGEIVAKSIAASRDRIGRSFAELFGGYGRRAEDVLNETVRVENYSGRVIVRDINFYSYCEHHFAPFFGTADVTYEPGKIITGLGKIVRLVSDVHARRLQIQEVMTKDICEDLMRVLEAKGARVTTRAKHLCMCSRGPSDDTVITEVSYGLGTLDSV